MTQIPKKLNKCPLVDVIFEIRFSPIVTPEVVFPMIYNKISNDFGKIESLPISQMPAQIRDNDPNLEFAPHFRLRNKLNSNHILQIGPKVVVWSSSPIYSGWESFRAYTALLLSKVIQSDVFNNIIRIGFRATNFFEGTNIFENKLKAEIRLGGNEIKYRQTMLRTEIIKGEFHSTVQILNDAQVNLPSANKTGSLIDIDTFCMPIESSTDDIESKLDRAHEIEKEIFFSLLKEEFLNILDPIY